MNCPTLSLSVFYIIFLTIFSAIPSPIAAQSTPILVVNKTNCDIDIEARCTTDEDDCDPINFSTSVTVPAHSNHLFDDSNVPDSGCDGSFAHFKFSIPGLTGSYQIAFSSTTSSPCTGILPCIAGIPVSHDYTSLPSNCIGQNGGVRGQYHANPSAGSYCHMVFYD